MTHSIQTVNRETDARQLMPEPRTWTGPTRVGLMDQLRERLLRYALRSLGPLHVEPVPLPATAVTLEVMRPALPEGGQPGDLPVWTDIWPSGVMLAGMIARDPARLQGRRVLELGPGVGVTAGAATRAGAELLIADSAQGALMLAAHNARRLSGGGRRPRTLLVNWRRPSEELYAAARAGFDVVLAADILYEDRDVKPLIRLVERVLAPDGEVWLAEPGRDPAQQFIAALEQRGWLVDSEDWDCPWPDPHEGVPGQVTVHRLRRPLYTPARSKRQAGTSRKQIA